MAEIITFVTDGQLLLYINHYCHNHHHHQHILEGCKKAIWNATNMSQIYQTIWHCLSSAIHIQDTGTEDWISAPEELVTRGWAFNVFNITNNLDEQTIAIYTFELQGHYHHFLHKLKLGLKAILIYKLTFEGDLFRKL